MKLAFVVPVYHNAYDAHEFISSLLKQSYKDVIIYAVVNGGEFSFAHESVNVLHPQENLGYLGALRWVVESVKPEFDVITLCNCDLKFDDDDSLRRYVDALRRTSFAIAGPRIVSSLTQTDQNPMYATRLNKSKLQRLRFIFSNALLYWMYQSLHYFRHRLKRSVGMVFGNLHPYALHGSFVTLSKEYFSHGGKLDYPVTVYGEELFLAEEARRIGLLNLFVSNATIHHREHATTGKFKNSRQLALMKRSIEFILQRYYDE